MLNKVTVYTEILCSCKCTCIVYFDKNQTRESEYQMPSVFQESENVMLSVFYRCTCRPNRTAKFEAVFLILLLSSKLTTETESGKVSSFVNWFASFLRKFINAHLPVPYIAAFQTYFQKTAWFCDYAPAKYLSEVNRKPGGQYWLMEIMVYDIWW